MTEPRERFLQLLEQASEELFSSNRGMMGSPNLLATKNVIDNGDVELFFEGIDARIIRMSPGGKFNTFDRPTASGRWSLLSRSKEGGWYNAEYLPQLAAYVDAILRLGYSKDRVFFELPPESLQLDLAILDDTGTVVVLGEAKRSADMLPKLIVSMAARFATAIPGDETRKRGDEGRQLAWRLWTARPRYCWMIAPGQRLAYACDFPLNLDPIGSLPRAEDLGLAERPPRALRPPRLH